MSNGKIYSGVTMAGQDKLPKLPIPPLEETIKRYIRATKGLQTAAAQAKTEEVAEEFMKKDGPELHEKLKSYAANRMSYIEEFWDESYLNYEDPVVLSLNPFFILQDDPTPARGSQLIRASSLVLSALGFIHDLRTGQLPPDDVRGTPLDMFQYTRLFGTARIPTDNGCRIQSDPESRHIVVMRRGEFYWFDVLDSQHRPLLTERSLLMNLEAIIAESDKTPVNQVAQGAIGVLSTENRKVWASLRDKLNEDEDNGASLEIMDKALFVLCLDDTEPVGPDELCENMLCGTYKLDKGIQVGTCTNRYYDKLQIIVCANGAAGVNFEHSGVDGHTVLRFVADVYTNLILLFAKSINSHAGTLFKAKISPYATGGGKKAPTKGDAIEEEAEEEVDTTPKKLDWNMTPELKMGVRFAETRLSDLICQNEVRSLEFEKYGKNFITRHGFSPDAFVQMAFQATYFSLYGRTDSTYEPAMTKAFLHGRTESIRTVQPESVKFVKTFCSDAPDKDKIAALRDACKAHTNISRECSKGLGQDRILYAMYCLATQDGQKLPAFFEDPAYSRLSHSTLSTSNCGNPSLRFFGFAAVVPDGFGIGYIIKDDGLSICASSKHLQTPRFLDTLRAYLMDAQRMIVNLHREANRRPNLTFVDHHQGEVDAKTGQPLKHTRVRSMTNPSNGIDSIDDMMGGYGFFGLEDVEKVLDRESGARQVARPPVGTRLHLSNYGE